MNWQFNIESQINLKTEPSNCAFSITQVFKFFFVYGVIFLLINTRLVQIRRLSAQHQGCRLVQKLVGYSSLERRILSQTGDKIKVASYNKALSFFQGWERPGVWHPLEGLVAEVNSPCHDGNENFCLLKLNVFWFYGSVGAIIFLLMGEI